MQKRHVRVSLLTILTLVFALMFSQFGWWLFLLSSGIIQMLIGFCLVLTHPLCLHGFVWTLAWRVYLCFYDAKFAHAINAMKWQSIINSSLSFNSSSSDWTVRYQTRQDFLVSFLALHH